MIIKLKKTIIFSAILCLLLSGCTSTSQEKKISGTRINLQSYSSIDEEPFYVQNRDSFDERKLSNGIPLVIKKSKKQKTCGIRLVIESIALPSPLKKAGLEDLTLRLMKEGSSKYSSLYVSSLRYTDSAAFMSKVHADYIEYGIEFQTDRISELIDVFADTFKNPLLSETKFTEFNSEDVQSENYLLDDLYRKLNEKDPYFAPLYKNKDSSILYSDVQEYHRGLQNASRIKIIASGNFSSEDIDSLYTAVNRNFGTLKSFQFKKKSPKKADLFDENGIKTVDRNDSQNISVLGYYRIPQALSDDYLCYGLLSLYLDDVLYNQIKEKLNYAGDAGTGVLLSKDNLGIISIYDVVLLKNISQQVYSAVENSMQIENIKKKFDAYKRIYTSFVMSSELTSAKTLDQMASCYVYLNDPKAYIERPYKISTITSEQIADSFNSTVKASVNWLTNGLMTK